MSEPIFVIHGKERRALKKRHSEIKAFIKGYWYHHQLDKDMCDLYGCHTETYPMDDIKAEKQYIEYVKLLNDIEKELAEKLKLGM